MMKRSKKGNFKFFDNFDHFAPGVAEMFILLGFLLIGVVLGQLTTFLMNFMVPEIGLSAIMLVSYPIMFIPAMIYASLKSKHNCFYDEAPVLVDRNNFSPLGGFQCALLVVLATISTAFACDAFGFILPEPPQWFKAAMDAMTSADSLLLNLISVSIFAPIFEEWLCRGMVLRGLLANKMKPVWAIVISALFFAFIHLNPWQALPAFTIGCLMGYVYYKTGSLKLTMLLHFTNNTFSLVLCNVDALKDMESWRDVMPETLYWVSVVACVLLTLLIARRFRAIKAAF